jgi:hypothetical protein
MTDELRDTAILAQFEQITEQAIDETCGAAAGYDHLDETAAILALQRDILAEDEMGRDELALALAAMAIRLHRTGKRGDPRG